FDYARAKPQNQPVGLPQPMLSTAGSAAQKQELDLRKANQNVPSENFGLFEATPVPIKGEPANAQAIYAVLDSAMAGVLTNPNANVADLLKTAETKTNQLLAADKWPTGAGAGRPPHSLSMAGAFVGDDDQRPGDEPAAP